MVTKEKILKKADPNRNAGLTGTRKNYDRWLDEWLSFRKMRVKESTYIRTEKNPGNRQQGQPAAKGTADGSAGGLFL